MRYIAVVGGRLGQDGLEEKMMKSNPILEAFGNSKVRSHVFVRRVHKCRESATCQAVVTPFEKLRHATGSQDSQPRLVVLWEFALLWGGKDSVFA